MDKSIQQSLLNTVNQIVNKQAECEDCKYYELAEAIETALNAFEERFSINLNEEQEDSLIEVGIRRIVENKKTTIVDLSEETVKLINKYSPEEVFKSIFESVLNEFLGFGAPIPSLQQAAMNLQKNQEKKKTNGGMDVAGAMKTAGKVVNGVKQATGAAEGAAGAAEAVGGIAEMLPAILALEANTASTTSAVSSTLAPTPSIKAGAAKASKAAKSTTTPSDDQETDDEEEQQRGEEAESTQDPFGFTYALHQQALAQVQGDPNRRNVSGYVGVPMNESEVKENPMKKHKKKVFKISFMDKGIKKKGTAVSHKGVMRIVSGKSSFKVYDEKNRDVTSLFKQQMKKDKK